MMGYWLGLPYKQLSVPQYAVCIGGENPGPRISIILLGSILKDCCHCGVCDFSDLLLSSNPATISTCVSTFTASPGQTG